MWWSRHGLLDGNRQPKAASSSPAAASAHAPEVKAEVKAEDRTASKPSIERAAGETARGPDGKRRKLAVASEADEVICLSD